MVSTVVGHRFLIAQWIIHKLSLCLQKRGIAETYKNKCTEKKIRLQKVIRHICERKRHIAFFGRAVYISVSVFNETVKIFKFRETSLILNFRVVGWEKRP